MSVNVMTILGLKLFQRKAHRLGDHVQKMEGTKWQSSNDKAAMARGSRAGLGAHQQVRGSLGPQNNVLLDMGTGVWTLPRGKMCLLCSPQDPMLCPYLQGNFNFTHNFFFFFTQKLPLKWHFLCPKRPCQWARVLDPCFGHFVTFILLHMNLLTWKKP